MPLFIPFKDNNPWRRVLSVVLGVAFIIWALVGVNNGHITMTHMNYTFSATRDPALFWLGICGIIAIGVACIYRGIRGKRDEQ